MPEEPKKSRFFDGFGIPARLRIHNRSHDRTIDRIKLEVELRDPAVAESHTEALIVEPQQDEERELGPASDYDIGRLEVDVHAFSPHPGMECTAKLTLDDLALNRGIVLCEVYAFQEQAVMRAYLLRQDEGVEYREVCADWT